MSDNYRLDYEGLQEYTELFKDYVDDASIGSLTNEIWNSTKLYNVNSVVIYNNALYKCIVQHTNVIPTNTTYWIPTSLTEVFQSVSNGKQLIADALTDKGIETSATDTFQTIVSNINNISTIQHGFYTVKRNTSASQSFEIIAESDGILHWSCIKNNWYSGNINPLLNGQVVSASYPVPINGINTYFSSTNGSFSATYWEVPVNAGDIITWSFNKFYNNADNNGCAFMWYIEPNK